MKRTIIIMAALMAISLGVCAQNKTKDMKQTKTLVAYFSASGTTKGVATLLAEVTGADLHEIKPEKPYTEADLDWNDKQSRSTLEMQDSTARPALGMEIPDLSSYKLIYLGYPIWWGVAPRIINTFIEQAQFDKDSVIIVPFATSGGSPVEPSVEALRATYPDLRWEEGILLNNIDDNGYHVSEEDMESAE